jgi:uncharacterized protein involved in type VI secretion and phage assembly
MASVLFGVVKDNADPDKLGRVQVSLLDWSGEVTLPWLRVMSPLASNSLGAVCLPDKDDHVIVLQGPGGVEGMVVIGSMYSGKRKPGALGKGKAGDPLVRGIKTPGGNQIVIDDTGGKETILVSTKDGKVELVLTNDGPKVTLTVKGEVTVTADKKLAVKAQAIELKGDGVKIDAGSAKVEVKGGNVDVNGAQGVKIAGAMIELG